MATKTEFVPTVDGITAFLTINRIDFLLDGPNREPARASVFYNALDEKPKLGGKMLKVIELSCDTEGEPSKLKIKFDRKELILGRRKKAAGDISFFTSLNPPYSGPKTAAEILTALKSIVK